MVDIFDLEKLRLSLKSKFLNVGTVVENHLKMSHLYDATKSIQPKKTERECQNNFCIRHLTIFSRFSERFSNTLLKTTFASLKVTRGWFGLKPAQIRWIWWLTSRPPLQLSKSSTGRSSLPLIILFSPLGSWYNLVFNHLLLKSNWHLFIDVDRAQLTNFASKEIPESEKLFFYSLGTFTRTSLLWKWHD